MRIHLAEEDDSVTNNYYSLEVIEQLEKHGALAEEQALEVLKQNIY